MLDRATLLLFREKSLDDEGRQPGSPTAVPTLPTTRKLGPSRCSRELLGRVIQQVRRQEKKKIGSAEIAGRCHRT